MLIHEKLDQAAGILREQDVDLWLTLVRETLLTKDPCLDLIAGTYCAWQSAFLVAASGERIAIVGRFDAPTVRDLGAYGEVVAYDESLAPHLLAAIERLDPRSIALNYSTSDPAADGLTHGLWLALQETLAGTAYADRLVSSEAIVNALRGRKSVEEVRRIRAAVADTEEIFDRVTASLEPGQSELEIAAVMHDEVAKRGLGYAWGEDLPGRERRPRQGRRALGAERAPPRARPAAPCRLRRLAETTTRATSSESGTSPTATRDPRRGRRAWTRSGPPSTPAWPS